MYRILYYGGLAGAVGFGVLTVIVFYACKVKAAFDALYWAAYLQRKEGRR